MANIDKIRKAQDKKNTGKYVAEAIWLSIGGIGFLCGLTCLVLGLILTYSPIKELDQAQKDFGTWIASWWGKFPYKGFTSLSVWLLIIFTAYLLIVLAVYANKQDKEDKKIKAKKLREKNVEKFLQEQKKAAEVNKTVTETNPVEAK